MASRLRGSRAAVLVSVLLAGIGGCSGAAHRTAEPALSCSTRVSAGRPIAVAPCVLGHGCPIDTGPLQLPLA